MPTPGVTVTHGQKTSKCKQAKKEDMEIEGKIAARPRRGPKRHERAELSFEASNHVGDALATNRALPPDSPRLRRAVETRAHMPAGVDDAVDTRRHADRALVVGAAAAAAALRRRWRRRRSGNDWSTCVARRSWRQRGRHRWAVGMSGGWWWKQRRRRQQQRRRGACK